MLKLPFITPWFEVDKLAHPSAVGKGNIAGLQHYFLTRYILLNIYKFL
jgi:hypothetical protein